ncbi:MAG: TonB-dependent receptor [Flavobacteriales bacterium]
MTRLLDLAVLVGAIMHAGIALGQVEVRVLDGTSGEGIPYALLAYRMVGETADRSAVGDVDGRITLPLNGTQVLEGVLLTFHCMGYDPLSDTLRTLNDRTYRLRGATVGLREMVVTGQYAPGSAERAVQKVRVIDAQQIQRMAANNLGDALRNELNIRLSQDNILGTSLSMQGLGGQNVKVLIDGVPVIGRQDGNIDLAQIDLTGIERIEIVEGPLSVNYGTNALAGTINLITRNGGSLPATLKGSVYAEHIGRLNTVIAATKHWKRNDLAIDAGRNFFNGWNPGQSGFAELSPTLADSSRYQQWKPREQFFGRLKYGWNGERWSFGYKGEAMHDRITNRGMPRAPYHETAFDEEYVTVRLDNAVSAQGRFAHGKRFNALLAHDRYGRTRNTWFRDLTTLDEELVSTEGMQDTTQFTLTNVRAVFASAPDTSVLNFELGMDLNLETGAGERIGDGAQDIGDYAAFASLEYRPLEHITLRPGLRYAYNTRYGAPVIPSLNIRWQLSNDLTVRASYAQGFRAPSLKELYFYFVDVNHDIVGNEDLNAERSQNLSAGLSLRRSRGKGTYTGEVSGFYNVIADLITLAQVSGSHYTYVNIGEYRTAGGSVGGGWDNGAWSISVGGAVTGRYDAIAAEQDQPYLFTPEARASITRQWSRSGWSTSVFWKYQGELTNYVYVSGDEITRGSIAAYQMADASVTKRLWDKRLGLTLGCKDLFDVQNLDTYAPGGTTGVHNDGASSVPMSTGRTFFVKLELDLKKKWE